MKRHVFEEFEEDPAGIESREKNLKIVAEFQELYEMNCKRSGCKLTHVQNTKMFMTGAITRLLLPPRTHHADSLRRVGKDMWVQVKK